MTPLLIVFSISIQILLWVPYGHSWIDGNAPNPRIPSWWLSAVFSSRLSGSLWKFYFPAAQPQHRWSWIWPTNEFPYWYIVISIPITPLLLSQLTNFFSTSHEIVDAVYSSVSGLCVISKAMFLLTACSRAGITKTTVPAAEYMATVVEGSSNFEM